MTRANLEWVERRWREWITQDAGRRALVDPLIGLASTAKLFAAFCLERLDQEMKAEDALTGPE